MADKKDETKADATTGATGSNPSRPVQAETVPLSAKPVIPPVQSLKPMDYASDVGLPANLEPNLQNVDAAIEGRATSKPSMLPPKVPASQSIPAPVGGLASRLSEVLKPSAPKPVEQYIPPAQTKAAPSPEKIVLSSIALPPLPDEPAVVSFGDAIPIPASENPPATPLAAKVPPAPPIIPPIAAIPSIPSEKKIPGIVEAAPAPAKAPLPPASGSINTDIEKILREVKLPERRDFKGAADSKQPPVPDPVPEPKNLGAMVTKPPTTVSEAEAFLANTPQAKQISSVHTLKDDLQIAVKEKKMSLVRAVSLQQDKKRTELIEEDFGRRGRHKRVFGILFATFLLFALGFAALFGVFLVMQSRSATDVESLNSLVFAEQSVALPLDNATAPELKRRVAGERGVQTGSLGSITRIVPLIEGTGDKAQPRAATTQEFFTAMGFNAPNDLMKAMGTTFFFGLHVVDENAPVLVVPVTNYDRAFAGMLAWEKSMNSDLAPTFTPVPSTVLDVNGIPSERIFADDVMRNYDVREIKDDSGSIQLYYSFPSPNLLIIAESQYSFPELLSRLQSIRKL